MERPIQVGDRVRILVDNVAQEYPIIEIVEDQIFIQDGENRVHLIPEISGEYKVENLEVPHTLQFINGQIVESHHLHGSRRTSLQILARLDDADLEAICQADKSLLELCQSRELWEEKIENKFGGKIWSYPSVRSIPIQELYHQLNSYPLTVGGANLALIQNDPIARFHLTQHGIMPNINQNIPNMLHVPIKFKEDILEYLRTENLGPIVGGNFDPLTGLEVNPSVPFARGRLQDVIYSLQPTINNQTNPLYGIFLVKDISGLMTLAVQYQNLRSPEGFVHISTNMRKYLREIFENVINDQINFLTRSIPDRADYFQELKAKLLLAIDDPTIQTETEVQTFTRNVRLLNSNKFAFIALAEIIAKSRIHRLTPGEINQLQAQVAHVYDWLLEDSDPNPVQTVLQIQGRIIESAGFYGRKTRNR